MAAPNRELEPTNLRLRKSELAAAWADVSHALRGFYELADILIVLDEVLLLEISNFARQLKFSPVIGDDHPIITHLTASLWFRSMELTITSSTSKSRGPSNERKNVSRNREAAGVDGVSTDTRKRQVAIPDTKVGKRYGEDEGECSTSCEANLGFS